MSSVANFYYGKCGLCKKLVWCMIKLLSMLMKIVEVSQYKPYVASAYPTNHKRREYL